MPPIKKIPTAHLLNLRNTIEKQLFKNSAITYGGSAGITRDGSAADFDIVIHGERFNIQLSPR